VTLPTRTPDSEALLDEALDWVVRLKTGEPTRADIEALQHWRGQSAEHEEAFRAAARLFRNAGIAASELADQQGAVAAGFQSSRNAPERTSVLGRRAFLSGAIAASAAGYLVVYPPLGLWPSLGELSADYRTGKGEQRKVVIAPDLSLELNTQTSIALRSSQGEMQIELIAGEASVAAKLASSRQMVMLAGSGRISATQANFNARCLDGLVSVTCLDGAVSVEHGGNTVQLRAAEQVSYSGAGLDVSRTIDAAQVTAWQTGLLVFRDRPLVSVVEEVNRYRSGKIIITSADLKRRIVNGTFQLDKLENFVAQVEQLFGARVTSLPGGVVLLS
jgi:transmembrane sensor